MRMTWDSNYSDSHGADMDAPDYFPAGSMVQYEVREDCIDEDGEDTGYFRVIGYEADVTLVCRNGT